MSHVALYETQIRLALSGGSENLAADPGWQTLQDAVDVVAKEHGGQVTDSVTDTEGRRTRCDVALSVPEFRRGVGVRVNRGTGEVSFVYDTWGGYERTAQAICAEILQNYTALAVSRALAEMHYQVDVQTVADEGRLGKKVLVRGEL